MTAGRIVVTPFDEALLGQFVELSARFYDGGTKTSDRAHTAWKLLESPAGPAEHIALERGGEVVGRVVLQRRDLRHGDQTYRGGYTVDLLVDPKLRKPTDALQLIGAVPKAKTFDIVFQTSNENSAPVYTQLQRFYPGYVPRFELLPYGFPLRARRPVAALLKRQVPGLDALSAPWRWAAAMAGPDHPGITVSTVQPDAPQLVRLVDGFAANSGLQSVRTGDVLRWRFAAGSQFRADVVYLREGERLVGYAATTLADFADVRVLALLDAVWDRDCTRAVSAIKAYCLRQALAQGVDLVFTMLNPLSSVAARLVGFPFMRLPTKLLKHPTPIYIMTNNPELSALTARTDAYIMLTDLDYF